MAVHGNQGVPPCEKQRDLFWNRAKERRQGIISAERVMVWGEACLLAAMEDITDARRLEQEILKIGLRERQNIAMSLHDDLCPQLIGIEVMVKMLHQHLNNAPARDILEEEIGRTKKSEPLFRMPFTKPGLYPGGLSRSTWQIGDLMCLWHPLPTMSGKCFPFPASWTGNWISPFYR